MTTPNNIYDLLNAIPTDTVAVAPPDEYIDAQAGLIPEGTYDVALQTFEEQFSQSGTFLNRIRVPKAIIVGVPDESLRPYLGRTIVGLTIFTKVYDRRGKKASGLGDIIRGIDDTLTWTGLVEARQILQEACDKRTPIQMRLNWGAYDAKGADAAGAQTMDRTSQEYKELRAKASIKGMRSFRELPDGTFYPEAPGPLSGEMLEARLEIANVTRSSKRRELITS